MRVFSALAPSICRSALPCCTRIEAPRTRHGAVRIVMIRFFIVRSFHERGLDASAGLSLLDRDILFRSTGDKWEASLNVRMTRANDLLRGPPGWAPRPAVLRSNGGGSSVGLARDNDGTAILLQLDIEIVIVARSGTGRLGHEPFGAFLFLEAVNAHANPFQTARDGKLFLEVRDLSAQGRKIVELPLQFGLLDLKPLKFFEQKFAIAF